MSPERFHYLLQRYKDDILSEEEWEELRPVLQSGKYDEFIKEDIFRLVRGEIPSQRERRPLVRRILRPAAIAASLLFCILSVWLLWPAARHEKGLVRQASTTDTILPGGNKAILILANGEHIVLDSVHDGKIARQGVTTVVRSGGRIGYDAAGTDSGEVMYNTITTPKGGQYEIVLADGSRVWLNSASSLRYPTIFRGGEREVELTGEGYFEIEKNVRMPFFVKVNTMKVQVLGTRFNTMAYADEATVNTTLLEGSVVVKDGQQARRLIPGQQVALDGDHRMILSQADIEKTMAWKNGLFEFDRMDIAAIMRQVARWYDVEIIFEGVIDHTPLGGSISKSLGLTEVLRLLESNGLHHFKVEGKKIYITKAK